LAGAPPARAHAVALLSVAQPSASLSSFVLLALVLLLC